MTVREDFTITEKAPTGAFLWLQATLALSHLKHYAKPVKHSLNSVGAFSEIANLRLAFVSSSGSVA